MIHHRCEAAQILLVGATRAEYSGTRTQRIEVGRRDKPSPLRRWLAFVLSFVLAANGLIGVIVFVYHRALIMSLRTYPLTSRVRLLQDGDNWTYASTVRMSLQGLGVGGGRGSIDCD